MQLNIAEERSREDIAILKLEEEMDVYTYPKLKEKIANLVREGMPFIILDLKGLSFIDSAGFGAMNDGLKMVRQKKGDIVLVNARGIVQRILDMTGMCDYLKTYADYDIAIESFCPRR